MKNSDWVLVKMSKSVVANLETDGIKYMDSRLQPFITWLQFMNFVTIAIISLVFLKIYNGILLLYEWIFPFKHSKLRYPLILVIGSKNKLNLEIVSQLSRLLKAKVTNLQDVNDNAVSISPGEKGEKQSQILYSQVQLKSQEEILKMSKFVRDTFGDIDVLLVSQNEEPAAGSGNAHVFLNNLNTQLLIQFWTVMAFLPRMLQKNHGHIVSIALSRTSNLTNTGIMRSVYEELLQTETKVKLTLIEKNNLLENYLPALPTDLLAKMIIRSIWSSNSMITVPSLLCYILMIPLLISQLVIKPVVKLVNIAYTRHHQESVFR